MRPAETAPPADRSRRRRTALLSSAVAAFAVLALAAWLLIPSGPAPLTQADVDRAVQGAIEQSRQQDAMAPPEAAAAYQTIAPSVVTVTTGLAGGPGETGLGTGVIVTGDGTVLTALHVVAGATRIQVDYADGSSAGAVVTTAQPETDIAVLAVDALPAVVVPAVLAGPPAVGDTVFAVGNPLGLRYSLSAGVVSATGRSIGTPAGSGLSGLIQFDAAVNPGNSGGPLLNRAGQVVGIVTALANPAQLDFFVGIGFAVPIDVAGGAAGGPQQ